MADRLGDVRPSSQLATDHAGHDRWLVVRFTTDPVDLTPDETVAARALLSACTDCAALAADLGAISHAVATSVMPSRPRDFRLTPEDAVSAQGSVLDRIRRWLGSPRAVVLRPLAGAALAIGLVLVLVSPVLRPPTAVPNEAAGIAPKASVAATVESTEVPGPQNPEAYAQDAAASPQPNAMLRMTVAASASPAGGSSDTAAAGVAATQTPQPNEAAPIGSTSGSGTSGSDDTTFALTLLGIGLALTGLIVLVLTWLARRWQDPLLRS
jgi:hypothetical protein